jgi:uracil phosphoribosyltransferase
VLHDAPIVADPARAWQAPGRIAGVSDLTVLDHPLAHDLLSRLRDERTEASQFRILTRRLGWLLVLEATKDLATEQVTVQTPMEPTPAEQLSEHLVAVPVLRAGLGLLDAVTDLYPGTVVGYLGMERDEVTLQPRDYYAKLPPMQGRRALILDPMLATGGSATAAIEVLKRWGAVTPVRIKLVNLIAAPEGVEAVTSAHPDVEIHCAALDRQLNEKGYIMPGLGDAGDRQFGTGSAG